MRENQKFFSLRDPATARITAYLIVANRETPDDGRTILAGNARVLTARLADAEFFWKNDLRTPLDAMLAKLDDVTFHGKLGTQGQRIERIARLARIWADRIGADPGVTERAARFAKADLASQMVFEFPELQGTMGRYYAERAGENSAVAVAAEEHYSPVGPSDSVPRAPVSIAVALADKIDMLAGFWGIDERPSGSKDPFALRRAAVGVGRLVLENELRISLSAIADDALDNYNAMELGAFYDKDRDDVAKAEATLYVPPGEGDAIRGMMLSAEAMAHGRRVDYGDRPLPVPDGRDFREYGSSLVTFIVDRLKVHLRAEGIRHDVIDACFQLGGQDDLVLLVARVRALQAFLATEDGEHLLTGYKRATNILEQEERKDGVEYSLDPDPRFAETPAERALFAALDAAEAAIAPALAAEDFAAAMTALARLRTPIDAFFDTTTVNADSPAVRRNRLCLLNRIRSVMNRVAVFSAVEGG
jgi:glycyl-tRNA synthetase beta chain